MIKKRELAGFIRCLESDGVEAELIGEPVRQRGAEVAGFVKEADVLSALACFHHPFDSAGIERLPPRRQTPR